MYQQRPQSQSGFDHNASQLGRQSIPASGPPQGQLGPDGRHNVVPPAQPIITFWYPAVNNWNDSIAKMQRAYTLLRNEFTGQQTEQQRAVAQTQPERAADALYQQSGGKLGKKYEQKTRTAKITDLYIDFDFREGSSWVAEKDAKDFSGGATPARWRRLGELCSSVPYQTTDYESGAFNPHQGRVYQGAIEDFYLIAGMQAVGMKSQLIANIFCNMDFSDPRLGVFTMRFYKHGQWMSVTVDDSLPFDKGDSPLCAHGEYFPDFAWPSLIEKAYAKLHQSWEGLGGGGHIEEVMTDLTGGCASRFGTTDVAGDRLWQYLDHMQSICIFACNINEAECRKRSVPIACHWAASIYRVAKHGGVPYVQVCLAAPVATVRHLPVCDLPQDVSPEGYGIQDGFVWLRIEDFVAFFDTIYECRLVNSDLGSPQLTGIPYSPGWYQDPAATSPWYEEIWAFQGDVYSETAPSFLLEVGHCPNELTLEVSQTDLRYSPTETGSAAPVESENSRSMQAPVLLRFYQCSPEVSDVGGGEIYMVHLSPWGHCRDTTCGVKVMRPGKYLVMASLPAKYVCHRMIFRCYSTKPVAIRPVTNHRSWVVVNPAMPLDAMPYSLAGFQRIDSYSERLPQMFDEAEGRGKPLANAQTAGVQGLSGWKKQASQTLHKLEGNKRVDGLKVVGKFGGKDAVATVEAVETQEGCSVM